MFAKLDNRYCFSGKLQATSALHIGSGSQDDNSDMPVIRDSNGRPFIPGSSLRGVMRSLVERTLAGVMPHRTCLLFDRSSHSHCPTVNEDARKLVATTTESRGVDAAVLLLLAPNPALGRLCDTCLLFGSPFMASKLKIADLPLLDAESALSVRHGVGIDRDTGRAADAVKYDYEVVEMKSPGWTFRLEVIGENLNANDFSLLAIAWKQMESTLTVGGKAGSGLGRCKLTLETVRYFNTPQTLKAFLLGEGERGYATKNPAEMGRLLQSVL